MNRFLMLVGVAAVAGAMYAAAASGSQQAVGTTPQQFAALKRQVAVLSRKVRTAQKDVNALAFAYVHCSLHSKIGIDWRGDPSGGYGYTFSPDGINSSFTTGLDLDTSGSPTYVVTPFNNADSGCRSLVGFATRRNAGSAIAQQFARQP